ncbi:Uu.00g091440.m01.CDS01 [Anthostomella pinea]|uniref:Uu.00g091440.m01.CDS01 n=1 Tax=Anthostomella pinea TaxID=933095 RepID=A0AAI8VHM4_9PEZI|nr:Uu.00g091440.m01.CDS01 [Anthostomella pinea]
MRLVCRVLRDVKPKRSILHPRIHIPSPCSQFCARNPQGHALLYSQGTRRFSTTLVTDTEDAGDLLLNELSDTPSTPENASRQQELDVSLVQQSKLFGRWRPLLTNPHRLAIESDFTRRGPAKEWRGRLLVDHFDHRGDFALWSCLLDYQTRVNGQLGALNVWRGLWGRKSLYDVDSPLAPMFWRVMLEAALNTDDEKTLESVWIYSEWMYDVHGVKWPQIYTTVMGHLLRNHKHQQALQWQLRLTPNFYPGPQDFADLVTEFATDKEQYRLSTLQTLYIVNPDHQLYDTLVPYLYNLGESRLAMKWRNTCVRYDDLPLAPVPARPFLRFLQGYFPSEFLHPEEIAATGDLNLEIEEPIQPDLSREFINRVHGNTFGISVKNYNDRLGAKWFASSWVSLNAAISTISALGIEKIGPLSLQSIALRENTSEGVLKRIAQLQEHGISVVDSNYFKTVLYLAELKDDELLRDLLESDLHPDVFDDLVLQTRLLESTVASSDWRTYRLLLVAKVVTLQQSPRKAANALVEVYFRQRDQQGLSRILADMQAMKVGIDHEKTSLIFESLESERQSTGLTSDALTFYLSVCQELTKMDVPVPRNRWRIILFGLIRGGKLDEVEKLCLELVNLFTRSHSARPGFVPMHLEDIPEAMKKRLSGVENLLGVYVPLDLPRTSALHPLRLLFDKKLMSTMIRVSFYTLLEPKGKTGPTIQTQRHQPQAFHCGRAVKFLGMLREQGLDVNAGTVARYVKQWLTTLYGNAILTKKASQRMRANNTLTLGEMKDLLDEAWGDELLPPLDELQREIAKRSGEASQKNSKYLIGRGRRPPSIRSVL